MAVAKEFLEERLEALMRQKLLFINRCSKCPYKPKAQTGHAYSERCDKCPVKREMLDIGTVLNLTLVPKDRC